MTMPIQRTIAMPTSTGTAQAMCATVRARVAAVDAAGAQRVLEHAQPRPDDVAMVVLGKAAELRGPLETKFGPVRIVTPEQCGRPPAR
jgi:hypothetical protein